MPAIQRSRVDELSDEVSSLYACDSFVLLDRCDGAAAWFVDEGLPAELRETFGDARPTNFRRDVRFATRVRSLFCNRSRPLC